MIKKFLLQNNYLLLILFTTFIISNYTNLPILVLPVSIIICFLTKKSKIIINGKIDSDLALLTFVFLSYILFALFNNNATIVTCILRCVPSIILFAIGYNLTQKNKDNNYIYFILLLTVSLTGIINIYYGLIDTIENGFIVPERMFGDDRDDFEFSTSLITSQVIRTIACVGLFFDNPSYIDNKRLRWFGIILAILGELCAMHYVSRAGILIMALSVIISLLYRFEFNFRTIFFILVTLFVYFYFLQSDAYAAFELKNEVGGDISTGNGRDVRMQYWLEEIRENPLGIANWKERYNQYSWAHNFWIDFTKECGWIPGFALVLFSLRNLYYIICIAFGDKVNKSIAQLILLLGISYTLTLFTEPTMQGTPLLMFSYFMFCGIVKGTYINKLR